MGTLGKGVRGQQDAQVWRSPLPRRHPASQQGTFLQLSRPKRGFWADRKGTCWPPESESRQLLKGHPTSPLSCISEDEGVCSFSESCERMDLSLQGSPCELPPAYHPHRPGLHQKSQCLISYFQMHRQHFLSTADRAFLALCIK